VELGGKTIASTTRAWRVLETSHPPTYYLPRDTFFAEGVLRETSGSSWCEWKGQASYYDLVTEKRVAPTAAWSYLNPFLLALGIPRHQATISQLSQFLWLVCKRRSITTALSLLSKERMAPEYPSIVSTVSTPRSTRVARVVPCPHTEVPVIEPCRLIRDVQLLGHLSTPSARRAVALAELNWDGTQTAQRWDGNNPAALAVGVRDLGMMI
jgi:uncharacterized protein (DUF427 family)